MSNIDSQIKLLEDQRESLYEQLRGIEDQLKILRPLQEIKNSISAKKLKKKDLTDLVAEIN